MKDYVQKFPILLNESLVTVHRRKNSNSGGFRVKYVNIVSGSLPSPGSGEKGHRFSVGEGRVDRFSAGEGRYRFSAGEGRVERFSAEGRGCLCRKVGRNNGSLPEEEISLPSNSGGFRVKYVNIVSGSLPSLGSGEKGHRFSAREGRVDRFSAGEGRVYRFSTEGKGCLFRKVGRNNGSLLEEEINGKEGKTHVKKEKEFYELIELTSH
ncbi:hypothetical protein M5K25_016314 [Dendrobium thyrsiflorum]|uniref:Uncharacterized protein n=1 Tax=Dendrobium thyrsiflorum TaxID=117978 RepID=A0ABD0UJC8_DENTH